MIRNATAVATLLGLAGGLGCHPTAASPATSSGPSLLKLEATPGVVIRRACVPTGAELCFNARDDNCNGVIDEGCGVDTGLVQFAIAWEAAGADVDLQVTDPDGELVDVNRATPSGLKKDRDCPGRKNECQGQNMENVFLERGDPIRGVYRVVVRLEQLGGENPPIDVVVGARVGPKTYQLELQLLEPEDEKTLLIEL